MFAVIKTGGKQYFVKPGDKIKIEKLGAPENKEVVFDEVLLIVDDKGKVEIGAPLIKEAKIRTKVIKQGKGKKVIVFKYRSKSRYKKKQGHRQMYTEVEILGIK